MDPPYGAPHHARSCNALAPHPIVRVPYTKFWLPNSNLELKNKITRRLKLASYILCVMCEHSLGRILIGGGHFDGWRLTSPCI
jgi:hypothetical protein